ncbi:hypothetical protein THARTR1_00152 [Trichoderma harzianum]|uniref:Uncharacterized protein n=1 Tax=Trichoderma harzianum TaxID=5544 RepID=A0A2K0UQT1_TRIHA|nr:hypothetical protein THARTR1_00152 [Trichoderma harzianum]
MAVFAAGLRRAALQMPSRFFVCNQCLRQAPRRSPSPILNIVRSRGYADAKPLEGLAAQNASAVASQVQAKASKAFPKKTTSKAVAYWLIGSAASCFGIVVWGGLTRLTESGYDSNSLPMTKRSNATRVSR